MDKIAAREQSGTDESVRVTSLVVSNPERKALREQRLGIERGSRPLWPASASRRDQIRIDRRAGGFLALRDVAAQHAELAILSPRTPEGMLRAHLGV